MKVHKLVNIHDGEEYLAYEGCRMTLETYPRAERLLDALTEKGWQIVQMVRRTIPTIREEGVYSFYLGGWDVLLEKELGPNDDDDFYKIVKSIGRNFDRKNPGVFPDTGDGDGDESQPMSEEMRELYEEALRGLEHYTDEPCDLYEAQSEE